MSTWWKLSGSSGHVNSGHVRWLQVAPIESQFYIAADVQPNLKLAIDAGRFDTREEASAFVAKLVQGFDLRSLRDGPVADEPPTEVSDGDS